MSQKPLAHQYFLDKLRSLIDEVRTTDPNIRGSDIQILLLKRDMYNTCRDIASFHIPEGARVEVKEAMSALYTRSLGLADIGGTNFQKMVADAKDALAIQTEGQESD